MEDEFLLVEHVNLRNNLCNKKNMLDIPLMEEDYKLILYHFNINYQSYLGHLECVMLCRT